MSKTQRLIHGFEQLDAIGAEKNIFKQQDLLRLYGSSSPLNWLLPLNFRGDIMLDLPYGMPAIDLKHMDAHTHPDLQGLLSSAISRLHHCKKESTLTPEKKKQLFYDILVNSPLKDAEILCSAKDKALTELYPTITSELVESVFPSYVRKI